MLQKYVYIYINISYNTFLPRLQRWSRQRLVDGGDLRQEGGGRGGHVGWLGQREGGGGGQQGFQCIRAGFPEVGVFSRPSIGDIFSFTMIFENTRAMNSCSDHNQIL